MTKEESAEITHTVAVGEAVGVRLDKLLADALPTLSRSRIKALIQAGQVRADGETIADPSYRVKPGQAFAVTVPPARPATPEPQAMRLTIVYEDAHLIVLDKPAGLVVHPAPGSPDATLVNALLAHCGDSLSGIGGVKRPGIVHRLDKETSGLLVVAKDDATHHGLAEQFAAHTLDRAYKAVVWGVPSPRQGSIEGNIGRNPANRKKMAVVRRGGKTALTHYTVLRAVGTQASLVECRLATGRTHQIRVHLASQGHPVIGDKLYGRPDRRRLRGADEAGISYVISLNRHMLHAYLIGFTHPISGERLTFETEMPREIRELVEVMEKI